MPAYAAVGALMATFFMIELNEGAYWAATMRVTRSDTGAATGVLDTGGNFAGTFRRRSSPRRRAQDIGTRRS